MGTGNPKLLDPVPQIPSGVDPKTWNFYFSQMVLNIYPETLVDYVRVHDFVMDGSLSEFERYAKLLEIVSTMKPSPRAIRLATMLKKGDLSLLEGDWAVLNSFVAPLHKWRDGPQLNLQQIELLVKQAGLDQLGLAPSVVESYLGRRAEFRRNLNSNSQRSSDQLVEECTINDHNGNDFAAGVHGAESPDEYRRERIYPCLIEESGKPERED